MQRCFFLISYFFIHVACNAQQYPFVQYTTKDGLVNSRVRKAYGKGIDREKIKPFSNGIMNIKKRMKEAGGTVEFRNGTGTTFEFSIPL